MLLSASLFAGTCGIVDGGGSEISFCKAVVDVLGRHFRWVHHVRRIETIVAQFVGHYLIGREIGGLAA